MDPLGFGREFFEEDGGILLWHEDAGGRQIECRFEGEELGACIGEEFLAGGAHVGGRGRDEDVRLLEAEAEFCDCGTEFFRGGLDG